MTDYDLLYTKFELNSNDAVRLNDLHRFAKSCHDYSGRIVVTTTITDSTGTKIVEKEEQYGELV
jgi:hypothetical protein